MTYMQWVLRMCVSIHAPTGGATSASCGKWRCLKFQFTRPRGARQNVRRDRPLVMRFNSRAHGGRDEYATTPEPAPSSFQFTRPRGARPLQDAEREAGGVSIHAPTGGATRALLALLVDVTGFNSRAHGGRDGLSSMNSLDSDGFNSRAHGGRDKPWSPTAP